jgi:predicted nucleic-acid-binding protein
VKIIVDTNILVRLLVRDDETQFQAVVKLISDAQEIVIPTHVICELIWVLSYSYKLKTSAIAEKIKGILNSVKVIINNDEIEAGLLIMEKGGDFADGINAYTGSVMASDSCVFVSFDKQAVRLFTEEGIPAMVPALR